MRRVTVLLVAALLFAVGGAGRADEHAAPGAKAAARTAKKSKRRRARRPPPPHPSATPMAAQRDELVLSPSLMRQLQHNLVDAGYLDGTIDGRMSRRTRRALAEFQRDYHMVGTGTLDRATADALLGRDVIGAYLVAAAPSTKRVR